MQGLMQIELKSIQGEIDSLCKEITDNFVLLLNTGIIKNTSLFKLFLNGEHESDIKRTETLPINNNTISTSSLDDQCTSFKSKISKEDLDCETIILSRYQLNRKLHVKKYTIIGFLSFVVVGLLSAILITYRNKEKAENSKSFRNFIF